MASPVRLRYAFLLAALAAGMAMIAAWTPLVGRYRAGPFMQTIHSFVAAVAHSDSGAIERFAADTGLKRFARSSPEYKRFLSAADSGLRVYTFERRADTVRIIAAVDHPHACDVCDELRATFVRRAGQWVLVRVTSGI